MFFSIGRAPFGPQLGFHHKNAGSTDHDMVGIEVIKRYIVEYLISLQH